MGPKRYTPEQIAQLLREVEVLLSKGRTVSVIRRELGFGEEMHYRRRHSCGSHDVKHARRLKELERENAQLKQLLGGHALDIAILKDASRGNWRARRVGARRWNGCAGRCA